MTTKTCMPPTRDAHGRTVQRRRPHDVPSSSADGYAQCAQCGVTVYVGQGEQSPAAGQRREHLAALADRKR